jgi:hypothetical protein
MCIQIPFGTLASARPIKGALVSVISSTTGTLTTLTNDDTTSEDNPRMTDQFGLHIASLTRPAAAQ